MWFSYLRKEMPFLFLNQQDIDEISLDSLEFANVYTGSRFLSNTDSLNRFNVEEVHQLGRAMWNNAISDGVEADNMTCFLMPSLLFVAKKKPEKIHNEKDIRNISAPVVEEYIRYRENVSAAQRDLNAKFDNYTSAAGKWLSKVKLADKIIVNCPSISPALPDIADAIRNRKEQRDKDVSAAKQNYLNGLGKPCKGAPESLTVEYERLTAKVADRFAEVDKYLIWLAFDMAEKEDAQFIFSPDAVIRPASFKMSTTAPIMSGYGIPIDSNIYVGLQNTDLFAVTVGDEERIYALKGETAGTKNGYTLYRVDRNIARYIESGIFDYRELGNYKINENKVQTKYKVNGNTLQNKYEFSSSFFIDKNNIISLCEGDKVLVDHLSRIHRGKLYNSLYESG